MPTKKPVLSPLERAQLAAMFSDAAVDYPKLTFDQVAKQVLPSGFGRGSSAKAFRNEAKQICGDEHPK
jgi:hypothetical protein